jgi:hypothetical protein
VLDEQTLEAARKDDLFPLLWDICKIARSRNPTEVELDTAFALLEDRTRWMNIERDRIDERLYSCLSDLAAVHDFKSRMEVQRPALDRSVARKFLNSPDVQTSGYQIILNRHARKIRDAEFKNFDPPTADAPSKGLLRFVKAVGLHELQNGHDRVPAAKNLFWLTMRSQRHWLFEKAMREGRTPWTKEDIDADLRTISVRGTPRIRPTQ